MREINNKKFSLFFCFLILFQEAHAFARINIENSVAHGIKDETAEVEREKRSLGTILIVLSAVSAGIDIYKQVAGCDDFTPNLNPTIQNASVLQTSNNARAEAINLAWTPIESKEYYVERMASDLDIIRAQITNIDSLQADLITLLDQSILDKLNELERELENQIEANNVTDVEDFTDLEAKFYTAGEFALTLSLKLTPVVLYLGFEAFPKVKNYVTNRHARNWAAANPAKAERVLGEAAKNKGIISGWVDTKVASFKASLVQRWLDFQIAHPSFQTFLNRFQQFTAIRVLSKGLSYTKTIIVGLGKIAAVGILVAYEIIQLIQFKDACEEKMAYAKSGYDSLLEQEANLTVIEEDMAGLMEDATNYYGQMKDNITNSEILNFLSEIVDLGQNALNQTDELIQATADVESYITNINDTSNSDERDEQLNKLLISALSAFNFKLDCLHAKVAILTSVRDGCASGSGTFEEIFADAQTRERSSVLVECLDNGYMTESEVRTITEDTMTELELNTICVRNSEEKKSLACSNWYSDVSDAENALAIGVTNEDLEYFINQCPPGPVSDSVKSAVCSLKESGQTNDQVLAVYHKLDSNALTEAYTSCNLSVPQQNDICNSKLNGYTLDAIQSDYSLYPPELVENQYNSCGLLPDVSETDKNVICLLVGFGQTLENIKASYGSKYEESALVAAIDECSQSG